MQVVVFRDGGLFGHSSGTPEVLSRVPSSVTVGSYDGIHIGHRNIIRAMVESARSKGLRSVVVTFEPHPRLVLEEGTDCPVRLLTTLDEKIDCLHAMGVDLLFVVRFDREFSSRSSESFIRDVLVGMLGVERLTAGYDHGFGRNRSGSGSTLKALGQACGFDVDVIPAILIGGQPVSSTRIRKLLLEGRVGEANDCLGSRFMISGTVVHGLKNGRRIGFPTANIRPSDRCKLLPARGAYVAMVEFDGRPYRAMLNIGIRPTISSGGEETIEAHILGYSGDLYGRRLVFRIAAFIRGERKFASTGELREQLELDKKTVELYPE